MRIGIIGAMEVEISTIVNSLKQKEDKIIAQKNIHIGKISNNDIFVCQSGMGKVNASMTAQMLIDRFNVEAIINTGISGALDKNLKCLDFILATDLVQHDFDATFMGYKKGEIPQSDGLTYIRADERLCRFFLDAQKSTFPDLNLVRGRIASGDVFVHDKDLKQSIVQNFDAISCEMEGAAIAYVSYRNKIPFVIIRIISDDAETTNKMTYDQFEIIAGKKCASLTLEVIGRL